MELSAYLQVLARRKWLVIAAGAVSVVIAIVVGLLTPPTYSASAMLRAIPTATASSSYAYLNYTDRNLNTLSKIATSSSTLAEVRHALGVASDHPIAVEVEVVPESELFEVTVKDRDPVLAANAANVLASIIVRERIIQDTSLYVAEPAAVPGTPSILTSILYEIIALTVGLGAGVGLAFLIENLDTRIYSMAELTALTGKVVLAEVPTSNDIDSAEFLVDQRVYYRDIFRRLRTNLQKMTQDAPLRSLLLTSSEPEEGKSTVVANLARSLADTGQRIAIIDADLRCPTLHEFFDLPNEVGLSQVLNEEEALSTALQETEFDHIAVLTSGPESAEASDLLASERMSALIEELTNEFNMILLDAPAVDVTSDAVVLSSVVDGVVLVSRFGWVRRTTLKSACQQLANVGIAPIGIVVNRTASTIPAHYLKYYQEADDDWSGADSGAGAAALPLSSRIGNQLKTLNLKKGATLPGRDRRKTTATGKTKLPAPQQLQPRPGTKGTA